MTSLLSALPDPELRDSFRRYYVWRDPAGRWHARPLRKLSPDDEVFRVQPELIAESLIRLATECVWHRCRRNIYRRIAEVRRCL
ncbi:hypothetical protein [Nonomuraea sp. NPDC046570]|uniref:hypothetical protein n=1 Tax=Nonomuraea sp. NPDC046570 TaxID=3155255 RepID=UPI0033E91433